MRAFRAASAALLASIVITIVVLLSTPTGAGALNADGEAYFAKINALRTSLGLGSLQLDPELTGLAQAWAEHMAATDSLAHPPDITQGVTSPWTRLGDNMASGPTFDSTWQALVESPVHYKNLTDPEFTHVGIGVAYLPDGTQYTHEWFMTLPPVDLVPEPEPEPEPLVLPPAPVPEARPTEVLPDVLFRGINLAVIPPISYGMPPPAADGTSAMPTTGSSTWVPYVIAAAVIALLLALATMAIVRARRRVA
jgi:uncharacterized protein YkwD